MADSKNGQPGWWEQISYGSGDFGFNLYWTTIGTFLLIFYTDSFGLPAAAAGTMLLATKLVDALVDPTVGALADRTRSRWGRFRPWLIWGAVPLAAAGILTFTTPHLDSGAKLIYAYITFTLTMVAYSAVNIPYGALSGVLTPDPQGRTRINSFRFVGGFLGGTFVTYLTPKFVKWLGGANEVLGWQLTMLLYGLITGLILLNLFLSARERVQPMSETPVSPLKDIADLSQNRPYLVVFALSLIVMLTISTRLGAGAYYIKYYVANPSPERTATFLTLYGFALAAGSFLTPVLSRFLDRRNLMILILCLVGVFSIAFYFIPSDQIGLIYAGQVVIGLCLGPKSPLTFAMYADCADYTEYKTGRRATAMTFSAASFAQKAGGALASFIIGSVLASLGYVANHAQSHASQGGILLLMSIIPGVMALLGAGLMFLYNLDDKRLKEIQDTLVQRKTSQDA